MLAGATQAGIRRAAVLATVLSDDATNVYVTLTAREMNPDLTIIARGENRSTERKLRSCGANTVVMPTAIGASRITQLILTPSPDELLERLTTETGLEDDLTDIGLRFEEAVVDADSPLAGRTLAEIEVSGAHGYLIVGIRHRDGTTVLHPPSSARLAIGDVVVVLGYHDDIPHLTARPPRPRTSLTYRGVTTSEP